MIENRKIRILVLIDYYLPGYKAGGPLRTLANMVERMSDEYEFWIVTRDRDFGDNQPYADVCLGEWVDQGLAKVFYVPKAQWGVWRMRELLSETQYDILYLNSFFSWWGTGIPLLLRRLHRARSVPVVIAPRGEFSQGALRLKAFKKQVYIFLTRWVGLYKGLIWQASSKHEVDDIANQRIVERRRVLVAKNVLVAPDLLPDMQIAPVGAVAAERAVGPLRLVFISRISSKKNLDFLLRTLQRVSNPVELAIYGPREDVGYWTSCQELIRALPSNVKVDVGGQVPHEEIRTVFGQHDIFVFPTRGENFGHVIFEALAAGTPVLVSDQTPWESDAHSGLRTLPLNEEQWRVAIESWAALQPTELLERRFAALAYSAAYLAKDDSLLRNKALFQAALEP